MRHKMKVEERAIREAKYMLEHHTTIRETAKVFQVSKSTVHKDFLYVLSVCDWLLYEEIRNLLNDNIQQRAYKGGQATKNKYLSMKKYIREEK